MGHPNWSDLCFYDILYDYGHEQQCLGDYMDNYDLQVLPDISRMAFIFYFLMWVLWIKLESVGLKSKCVTY